MHTDRTRWLNSSLCGFTGGLSEECLSRVGSGDESATSERVGTLLLGVGISRLNRSRFGDYVQMLTVVATCRQQRRNVLEYLTACFLADRRGQSIPSLLPMAEPAIKVA
jgi:hypothetical protein